MNESRLILKIFAALLGLGLLADLLPGSRKTLRRALTGLVIFFGAVYIAWRYWLSWPMTPMYLGTAAVPAVLTTMAALSAPFAPTVRLPRYGALILGLIIALASIFFPKDFYLPFLKTASIFSHLHLAFTILAKAALLLSGLWAWAALVYKSESREASKMSFSFMALGFVLWTLAMFSGEIWSYRGWGVPVVWDDAVITAFMATWFYYIGLLHLHLTGGWSAGSRNLASVCGIFLILIVNCSDDLGPFRPPLR
ncbi:MAG: cytochrome c biogenesis protein [Candidatus Adiutrix sp.]|jgi:hypothetical protein|nr:cytochrome c biogenesis protein [Candidatus Adiutrix sp.]